MMKGLISEVQDAGIYADLIFAEKLGDNLFKALALISPTEDELISYHKFWPLGATRNILGDGLIDQLKIAIPTYESIAFLDFVNTLV